VSLVGAGVGLSGAQVFECVEAKAMIAQELSILMMLLAFVGVQFALYRRDPGIFTAIMLAINLACLLFSVAVFAWRIQP